MATGTQTQTQTGPRGAAPPRRERLAPKLHLGDHEIQKFGELAMRPIMLTLEARQFAVEALNQSAADTMVLRDLYKKHHWQLSGPTFGALHELFDEFYEEQVKLVDELAERVQMMGGIAIAMPFDVAEATLIGRPPFGREDPVAMISRLIEAHEIILEHAHYAAKRADELGDDGTADVFVSSVIRTNEKQVWMLSEHLVKVPIEPPDVQ